jgi:signal transduction histidine kinase
MELHKLLLRQLKHVGLDVNSTSIALDQWQKFLKSINNTYAEEDNDRYLQDRAMVIVTSEMNDLNEKLNHLQEIAHIGYWYNNLKTGVIIWSKEMYSMFGLALGTRVPKMTKLFELIHPEDVSIVKNYMNTALAQGEESMMEIRLARLDSPTSYKWYYIITKPQITNNKSDRSLQGIIMDIDIHKKDEEKVLNLQQHILQSEKMSMIGQLSAGIAHEINNPLTYTLNNLTILDKRVNIFIDLLKLYQDFVDGYNKNLSLELNKANKNIIFYKEQKNIPAIVSDSNNLIAESINGLLRIKEIVANINIFSGVEKPKKSVVNLNDCIKSAIELVRSDLKSTCEINLELPNLPTVWGSYNQLMLVFVNLLLNATQAVENKGKVDIIAQQTPSTVLITIADNGCGISAENLTQVFNPFFTTKPIGLGVGLGLTSAYGIIQLHNGKISVQSELGYGAKFTVELPIM